MEEFAHRENIRRFERDLACELDAQQRRLLQQLLARERARLAEMLDERDWTAAGKGP